MYSSPHPHPHEVPTEFRKGVGSLRAGVIGGCELPNMDARKCTWSSLLRHLSNPRCFYLINRCFYFSVLVGLFLQIMLCDSDQPQPQTFCIAEDDLELLTLLPPPGLSVYLKAHSIQSIHVIHVNLPRVLNGCLVFHHLCI